MDTNVAKKAKPFEFIIPVTGRIMMNGEPCETHAGNLTVFGEGWVTDSGYRYNLSGVSYEGDIHAFAEFVNDTMKPPLQDSELHKAVMNHLKQLFGDMEHVLQTEAIEMPALPVSVSEHFYPRKKKGDDIY